MQLYFNFNYIVTYILRNLSCKVSYFVVRFVNVKSRGRPTDTFKITGSCFVADCKLLLDVYQENTLL